MVRATITCHRASAIHLCDRLTGPLATIDMKMWIQQDNTTPGIAFTASYTAVSPPPSLGVGIRPFGRVCAFGLLAGQLHFIKGPFDTTSTCHSTVQGRMILRPGMATRLAPTPNFWVTSETAMVAGRQKSKPTAPRPRANASNLAGWHSCIG